MKPFDRNITITPHAIDAQLARLRDLILKREEIEKQQWADTLGPDDCSAFDDDPDARKIERKR
jgi:hypothetical protein